MAINQERKLLLEAYKERKKELVEIVVKELQSLNKKEFLLSGDSDLRNVWEEISVQVQGETSYFWKAYEECIFGTIMNSYERQSDSFKSLVEHVVSSKITRVPFFESVHKGVVLAARRNKNPRVRRYNAKDEDYY